MNGYKECESHVALIGKNIETILKGRREYSAIYKTDLTAVFVIENHTHTVGCTSAEKLPKMEIKEYYSLFKKLCMTQTVFLTDHVFCKTFIMCFFSSSNQQLKTFCTIHCETCCTYNIIEVGFDSM